MACSEDKIIALIDMDCFFCQVEAREHPELQDQPMVVTQFNLILAVNYEAKSAGVERFIRADEAKKKYPGLNIVSVPIQRGKGDVSKYHSAGQEVIEVLKQHCLLIEKASVDEAYLDITSLVDERMKVMPYSSEDLISSLKNTFVVGYCNDNNDENSRQLGLKEWIEKVYDNLEEIQARKLFIAGLIVEEFRAEIFKKCKFKCSAGISYNKVLAKLASGLHKPNKQTVLPASSVLQLFSTLPINKVRSLGGKIGKKVVEFLGCNVMADLLPFSLHDLQKQFDEKIALKLYNIARGIDNEPIYPRIISKSIGSSKNFSVRTAITDLDNLKKQINFLAEDIVDRLDRDLKENHRKATALVISHQFVQDQNTISHSRTFPLTNYKTDRIIQQTLDVITKSGENPIVGISIAANKFVKIGKNENFMNYFKIKNEIDQINETSEESQTLQYNTENFENTVHSDQGSSKIREYKKEKTNIQNDQSIRYFLNKSQEKNRDNIKNDCEEINKQRRIDQLQEIFPELDNIDHSVLELLPLELQKEAENYLKPKKMIINNEKIKPVKEKNKLSKSQEKKNKNSNIQKFLIKNNTSGSSLSMVECLKCNQMIQEEKYFEHRDFHVAQDLQRNLNLQTLNPTEHHAIKRNHESGNTLKAKKKKRSIESYFSTSK